MELLLSESSLLLITLPFLLHLNIGHLHNGLLPTLDSVSNRSNYVYSISSLFVRENLAMISSSPWATSGSGVEPKMWGSLFIPITADIS